MQSNDTLFSLIHSLTQAEKRFFKVFSTLQRSKTTNNYVRLFDAIAGSKYYDEEALKTQFMGTRFIAHLSSEKVYLQRMILRAMRLFHEKKAPEYQVACYFQDAQFLFRKGLIVQAGRSLRKAKKLARKYENLQGLLTLLDFERDLEKDKGGKKMKIHLAEIRKEQKEVLQTLSDQSRFMDQYDRVYLLVYQELIHRKPDRIAALSDFAASFPESENPESGTFRIRLYTCQTQAVFHQLKGEHRKAAEMYGKVLEIWESHPHQVLFRTNRYRKSIANYLAISAILEDYPIFPETLERLKAVPVHSPKEAGDQFSLVNYYELLYLMNTRKWEAARSLSQEIETVLRKKSLRIPQNREMGFLFNLGVLNLMLEEFSAALTWFIAIQQTDRKGGREDLRRAAGWVILIIHYELGNHDLLPYLMNALRRSVEKNDLLKPFEQLLIGFLTEAISLSPGWQAEAAFGTFYRELIAGDFPNVAGIGEIKLWIRSREKGKPIRQIYEDDASQTESD